MSQNLIYINLSMSSSATIILDNNSDDEYKNKKQKTPQ